MSEGWIDAGERLPHWTEWVAVETETGEYGEGWYNDSWEGWLIESRWGLQGKVSRWKPKPEGPDFGPPSSYDDMPI